MFVCADVPTQPLMRAQKLLIAFRTSVWRMGLTNLPLAEGRTSGLTAAFRKKLCGITLNRQGGFRELNYSNRMDSIPQKRWSHTSILLQSFESKRPDLTDCKQDQSKKVIHHMSRSQQRVAVLSEGKHGLLDSIKHLSQILFFSVCSSRALKTEMYGMLTI